MWKNRKCMMRYDNSARAYSHYYKKLFATKNFEEIATRRDRYTVTAELNCFLYSPIISSDVDRTFHTYKQVLEDQRHSFLFPNLKITLILPRRRPKT